MEELKKILIIDDDSDILDALKLIFELEGYQTKTLIQGEKTYKAIKFFKPDVILLDVMLSGLDGRVICKNLKSDIITRKIPIIMISAHPGTEKSTKEMGANDFIAKPFDINTLIVKVESALHVVN